VIPAERSDVSEQRVVDGTTLPECFHGSFEVHRIPERDGGDHQIQTAGAIPLILIGAIPDLAQLSISVFFGQNFSNLWPLTGESAELSC
jgi:hypothetical protein